MLVRVPRRRVRFADGGAGRIDAAAGVELLDSLALVIEAIDGEGGGADGRAPGQELQASPQRSRTSETALSLARARGTAGDAGVEGSTAVGRAATAGAVVVAAGRASARRTMRWYWPLRRSRRLVSVWKPIIAAASHVEGPPDQFVGLGLGALVCGARRRHRERERDPCRLRSDERAPASCPEHGPSISSQGRDRNFARRRPYAA